MLLEKWLCTGVRSGWTCCVDGGIGFLKFELCCGHHRHKFNTPENTTLEDASRRVKRYRDQGCGVKGRAVLSNPNPRFIPSGFSGGSVCDIEYRLYLYKMAAISHNYKACNYKASK